MAVGAVGGSWRAGFNTKNTEVTKGFKEWFCARGGGHGMTRMITEGGWGWRATGFLTETRRHGGEREEKEFLGFSRRGVEAAGAPWRVAGHWWRVFAVFAVDSPARLLLRGLAASRRDLYRR